MVKKLKHNYGKLVIGLVLLTLTTISVMAQRAADSTAKRIDKIELKDKEQDECLKSIEVKLGKIETKAEEAERKDFTLHEMMKELLMSSGISPAAIVEIEMRRDTTDTNGTIDSAGGI